MKLRLAVAALAVIASAGATALPASAAHRYNVETGNGSCQPTSASATDNAEDPAKEQSENSEFGQETAAENSPAISGTGTSRDC